jgi:hypothetical protein
VTKKELDRLREQCLTVKEYAYVTREHPLSVYRRVREGRQPGVHRVGNRQIRLEPPTDDPDDY